MTAGNLNLYHHNGRLYGVYVYMLFCPDGDQVHIKIGQSDQPMTRLVNLAKRAPFPPQEFCMTETPGRDVALGIEHTLHRACSRWRVRRTDWFSVPMADKADFRKLCTGTMNLFREPRWPMPWAWISVQAFLSANRTRAHVPPDYLFAKGGIAA